MADWQIETDFLCWLKKQKSECKIKSSLQKKAAVQKQNIMKKKLVAER